MSQKTPNPRFAYSQGKTIRLNNLGMLLGKGFFVTADGDNLSGQTQFGVAELSFFPDDFFNDDWAVMGYSGTNITLGNPVRITDFTSSGGVVTTDLIGGGDYADLDELFICPIADLITLAGEGIGSTFTFTKDYTTGQVTTAGVTLATATGSVLIKRVSVQGTAITASSKGLKLTSNDTAPGALARYLFDEILASQFDNVLNGTSGAIRANPAIPIGHILATGKILKIEAVYADLVGTGLG